MWINPNTMEVSNEPAEGYETVLSTQYPLTARLEKAVPGTPELIDGLWYETWVIEPLTAAEEAQVIEAERVNSGVVEKKYVAALEAHYDSVAQSKRYDNRLTFALRAGYPGPYQAEALVFAQWMDNCNAMAYQYMLDVEAGKLERPTIEAMIEMLPNIEFSDGLASLEAEADNGEG